jgi:effector-binding domain-containing protein
MKKFFLPAVIMAALFMGTAVFGNDYQKSDSLEGDTAHKCSQITIEVKDLEPAKVMAIKATVNSDEVSTRLGEFFPRLIDCVINSGIDMMGPPYSKYYSWDPEGETEMEAGVPVSGEAECEGVEYIELPACKVVTCMHIGPYEKIDSVYDAIQEYITENKMKINGAVWEVYITDPNSEPDPEKYRTQVYFPIEETK